ncbi:ammonia-dependent NAD(+) synthetase [Sodalis sp. CWE]|uniref:ammonia-dependent NAD(+) synthetase n=1 Tax=Sodalis sp. CWE TaxID=2803816 RepID=UPI001C7E16DF|nr:ammonia-dependent NAD(+) synthetase [Sodalis sp. CWE]MBX4180910.1 ammonia-dependent NAD(+) synthetase [Sodalis sp. CWE]
MSKQQEIITILGVKSKIDPAIEFRISVEFLKKYLKKHQFIRTLVLGISGGQDSTLTGRICQQAINELRQETHITDYQFFAVRLPYGRQIDETDCLDAIKFIQPDKVITINIKKAVQTSEAILYAAGITLNDHVKGNEKARERMKVQYSIAGMTAGLVVGTHHAAEAITGYFTKYGDGGTDINPIFRLNKRQGQSLLKYLKCPNHLYLKIPTADLEDNRPALSDEEDMNITYEVIDDYLEGKCINIDQANMIENQYRLTEHKRRLPITIFDSFWEK